MTEPKTSQDPPAPPVPPAPAAPADLPAPPPAEEVAAPADMASVQDAPPKTLKPGRRSIIVMAFVAVAGTLAILYAWQLWPFTSNIVTTENAYVRGQITVLSPQVNGYVAEVLVQDFQDVRKGQPLIRIDDRIYRQRVEQSRADLEVQRFNLNNVAQTLASDRATLASRRADLDSAKAEYGRARADEARVNELASRGSVSVRERDQIRATVRSAAASIKRAQAAIEIAQETVKSTQVSGSGLQAQVERAQATLRLAEIDLANTVIVAPSDGQTSEVSVRLGQYVTAGSQLLYLVPAQRWIIANYKETQTHNMQPGQRASFNVDALGGAALTGRIVRLSPAAGSEFSVLRPDNATGNFTKIAQRIPVRISIDPDQALAGRLRPGMSVVAHVDTTAVRAHGGGR